MHSRCTEREEPPRGVARPREGYATKAYDESLRRGCALDALWILVQVATTVTTTYAIGPFAAAIMDERS